MSVILQVTAWHDNLCLPLGHPLTCKSGTASTSYTCQTWMIRAHRFPVFFSFSAAYRRSSSDSLGTSSTAATQCFYALIFFLLASSSQTCNFLLDQSGKMVSLRSERMEASTPATAEPLTPSSPNQLPHVRRCQHM